MKRWLRAATIAALFAPALPCRAFFYKPYYKQTLGSQNYVGNYASLDFGGDLHFKPAFNSYHSNTSSGTYQTFSLDANYEWRDYTITLTGGITPTVNNYNNYFVGGKIAQFYDLEGSSGSAEGFFRSVDLMGGVTQTNHAQFIATLPVQAGNKLVPGRSGTGHIQETDVEGMLAVSVSAATASIDLTKSVYDQDLSKLATRAAQAVRLAGLNQTIQGFPDFNAAEKITCDYWEGVRPYVGYTYTAFKVSQPMAATYTAGVSGAVSALKLDASYQRYAQKGSSDINYYSLSASMKFE